MITHSKLLQAFTTAMMISALYLGALRQDAMKPLALRTERIPENWVTCPLEPKAPADKQRTRE